MTALRLPGESRQRLKCQSVGRELNSLSARPLRVTKHGKGNTGNRGTAPLILKSALDDAGCVSRREKDCREVKERYAFFNLGARPK